MIAEGGLIGCLQFPDVMKLFRNSTECAFYGLLCGRRRTSLRSDHLLETIAKRYG
jgi:hypothetical protein